jgi:3-dehydroquinate synthase
VLPFNPFMSESLTVNLGERSYPIHFGTDLVVRLRADVDALRADGRKLAVVTDCNLAACQTPFLTEAFGDVPLLVLAAGEETKSLSELGRVPDFLAEHRLDRSSVLFAVGGGVIGDLGGFAAASFLRGIAFRQVPTTLLAMVDSSVGGKTGINLKAGKNLVGAFHQPGAVYVDTSLLATLPPREFAAGMAEVIKTGLLAGGYLWQEVRSLQSGEILSRPDIVFGCARYKCQVVAADEKDAGIRAALNLGHTVGHAIETVTGYSTYRHG